MKYPRRAGHVLTFVWLATAVSCDRNAVLSAPSLKPELQVPSRPSATMVSLGGEEFYGDDGTGALIPTSYIQARIEGMKATAHLDCPNGQCNGQYSAYHRGMWHYTKQTINWSMSNADTFVQLGNSAITKTGGDGCETWSGIFCTTKYQRNTHQAQLNAAGACRVSTHATTDHVAEYNTVAAITAGGVTIESISYGENSKSVAADALFTDSQCNSCDDPFTDEIETTCDPTQVVAQKGEGRIDGNRDSNGDYQFGGGWYCMMTDWYDVWMDGSLHYTGTRTDYCWVK